MNRLLNYLPAYERVSIIFKEIMAAEEIEFDKIELKLKDLEEQLIVDTATWGLAIYEKELGLPINPKIDMQMRRSLVKAKLLMQPPTSKVKFVEVLKSFIETAEIEELYSDYSFYVILKTTDTFADKLPYIHYVAEEYKPAHLNYIFIICYIFYLKTSIIFNRYFSERLKICGTLYTEGGEFYSTSGRVYKSTATYIYDKWFSSELQVVHETNNILSRGKSYKEIFKYNFSNWTSTRIKVCSESTYSKEVMD